MEDSASDCHLMQVHLAARAAGEDLGETEASLQRHLERCPGCRRESEGLEVLADRLRSELAAEPVPEEREVDWEAFGRDVRSRTVGAGRGTGSPRPATLGLVAAALLLAAALPLALLEHGGAVPGATDRRVAMGVEGSEAESFLRGVEEGRTRRELVSYLRGGRSLIVGLAGSPVFCRRDRRDVALERDVAVALLRRKQALNPALAHPALGRSREVSHELERMLRVVAYLGDCPAPEEVRVLLQAAADHELIARLDAALQSLDEQGGHRA
jgi:hypothetical protein